MTRITALAQHRRFEGMKIQKGKLSWIRREKVVPAMNKEMNECPRCEKPVFASPGQLLKKDKQGRYWHKICRKLSHIK